MAFSDEQKALALATLDACRGNTRAAAKFCQQHYGLTIAHSQIHTWSKGEAVHPECSELRTDKKEELADAFERVARAILASITTDAINEANLGMRLTSAGIATDKMQLLRNKPTQITDDLSALPDDDLDARIAALERGEVPPSPEANKPVSV